MSSYDSITQFADKAKALDRLDIAILNAGLFQAIEAFNPSTGYEESVQVNYFSSMLLMTLLLRSRGPTLAAFKKKAEKWEMQERATRTSKLLGQIYLTELAKKVPSSAVTIDAVNPGFCYGTAPDTGRRRHLLIGLVVNGVRRVIGKSAQASLVGDPARDEHLPVDGLDVPQRHARQPLDLLVAAVVVLALVLGVGGGFVKALDAGDLAQLRGLGGVQPAGPGGTVLHQLQVGGLQLARSRGLRPILLSSFFHSSSMA
ncbi:short-chain dehydrogenase [Trichoderma cornu-damae]|uniref:Short-chain dehydrogenase n=1 Tax=Trichoderma cornu-damae TaxID=654480 RepID=A0A9P8QT13_9HYPO|nr:short-chain dehydrogenase [Trichoderma cornu-damae]